MVFQDGVSRTQRIQLGSKAYTTMPSYLADSHSDPPVPVFPLLLMIHL